MVAQLLRLKLRLLANIFRRSAWQAAGIAIGLVYGVGLAVVLFLVLAGLRLVPDITVLRDGFIVAGSAIALGFVVFPIAFGIDDTMDPRRFALFGIPRRTLTLGLALSSLIGIPALVTAIALLGTVVTWSRSVGATLFAIVAAALTLATCMLSSRVATAFAAFTLATRRARDVTGVLGILLILLLSPLVVIMFSIDWGRDGVRVLEATAGVLGWTPLGAMWAIAGDAAAGVWGAAVLRLLIAAGTLGLLWLAWQALVGRMLVSPGRAVEAKRYTGLGWFDRVPHGAMAAITARSLSYWTRDARYWVSVLMIPIMPVIVLVPLAVAGVPGPYLALIPVPLMSIFIGWTLHNDTAYDSTAIWIHVASGVRGVSDRVGRMIPVLVLGIVGIGIGGAVSAALYGDWAVLPAIVGVSVCLLLTGLGIGSYTSARFPYPVVQPGDSPFQQPQASGTATVAVQSLTLLVCLLLAAPAVAFGALGVLADPAWFPVAFLAGAGVGLLSLTRGVIWGSVTFSHRGPELLAAAQRA